MKDGTVYAGISPDTGQPMYATPADTPLTMTFSEAVGYADALDAHGHNDWHSFRHESSSVASCRLRLS
jgi:hypothetical protein